MPAAVLDGAGEDLAQHRGRPLVELRRPLAVLVRVINAVDLGALQVAPRPLAVRLRSQRVAVAGVDLAEAAVEGDGEAGAGGDGLGGLPGPRHRARIDALQPDGG